MYISLKRKISIKLIFLWKKKKNFRKKRRHSCGVHIALSQNQFKPMKIQSNEITYDVIMINYSNTQRKKTYDNNNNNNQKIIIIKTTDVVDVVVYPAVVCRVVAIAAVAAVARWLEECNVAAPLHNCHKVDGVATVVAPAAAAWWWWCPPIW